MTLTAEQLDFLFNTQLSTMNTITELVKRECSTQPSDSIKISIMNHNKQFLSEDQVVRPEDCTKISVVRKNEFIFYRHGPARQTLQGLGALSGNPIPFPVGNNSSTILCDRCQEFLQY